MLTRNEKDEVIKGLREEIAKSKAIFLTNLVGLKSNDAVRIRKDVREADGSLAITKNSLFEIAAKGTACEAILKDLKGTNAVAFAYKDAPRVAKILYDAGKEFKVVELRAGTLGTQVLSSADLETLAKLPSRDQMLGTVLATFMAPASAFVRVLDAIKTKKEEGTAAA